jgi:hypothetical protein
MAGFEGIPYLPPSQRHVERFCWLVDSLTDYRLSVFPFSLRLADLEVFQLLRMPVPQPGHPDLGTQTEDFVSGILMLIPGHANPTAPVTQSSFADTFVSACRKYPERSEPRNVF